MDLDWTDAIGLPILVAGNLLIVVALVAHVTGTDLYAVLPLRAFERWVAGLDIPVTGKGALYLFLGASFGVAGLISTGRGVAGLRRAYTLWGRDPVPVGDLHLESGVVEVEGKAEPIEEYGTVPATYTGTDCLAFEAETKENRGRVTKRRRSNWEVVELCKKSRPFRVTDDTGTVVVDPAEATFSFDRDIVSNTNREIRTEWRLEPGETVYVSGRKRDGGTDGDAPVDAATYVGPGADSFTVSDASERWTVLRFTGKGALLSAVGTLFVGVSIAMLYFFALT